ncbi:hypothetical protein AKJ09_11251 [Labilithrix luteola]|uniref:Uncharacterized protein n=1 Tax=Labilithrix luteola TaxID=1391654 RepID=A0A0K1QFT9_9BACT|nr:hypothetical protein AKJ09_11251 [Labilithrix luteola]
MHATSERRAGWDTAVTFDATRTVRPSTAIGVERTTVSVFALSSSPECAFDSAPHSSR